VANYSARRDEVYHRKRKATRAQERTKRRKLDTSSQAMLTSAAVDTPNLVSPEIHAHTVPEEYPLAGLPPPSALQHLTIGINEVTKKIEAHIRSLHRSNHVVSSMDAQTIADVQPRAPIALVLVCRADINPPALVAHIPQLIASCNANLASDPERPVLVRLVSLHRGAERTLSTALGLKRVAVLGIDVCLQFIDFNLAWLLSEPPLGRYARLVWYTG
jgi:ribonuclease P/MRP protein subunit POP3